MEQTFWTVNIVENTGLMTVTVLFIKNNYVLTTKRPAFKWWARLSVILVFFCFCLFPLVVVLLCSMLKDILSTKLRCSKEKKVGTHPTQ